LQATKLVLKFKANEQNRREARLASLMDRVTSLIPELMLEVIEARVKSQFSQWAVRQSTVRQPVVLDDLAGMCFAWPRGVTSGTRDILKLQAAKALLKNTIVRVPIEFSVQNTLIAPPLLVGREHDLRHLALDLQTTPVDGRYNRELNKCIKVIPSLETHFPNMEVFVLSLYFHCETRINNPSFESALLDMRNLKRTDDGRSWQNVTMKDTAIELIQTFAQSAPQARKLIRFGHTTGDYYHGDVGPLVEVSSAATQVEEYSTSESEVEDGVTHDENVARIEAKTIFDPGYCVPRFARARRVSAASSSSEGSDN
jgi:hypothetical protein